MHNYHTEHYRFFANGDPIPGDVLIGKEDGDMNLFRSTSEEVLTFCAAHRLQAIGSALTLRTTRFEITGDDVTLLALTQRNDENSNHDALLITVPLSDLQEFAVEVVQRRFELYLDDRLSGESADDTMAAIGLFADLTKPVTQAQPESA